MRGRPAPDEAAVTAEGRASPTHLPSETTALTPAHADREAADVLVVGGGPAGSVTALLLARAGWSVTVLERAVPPRPKPCGECLNPGAVAALARLGLLHTVLALSPARLAGWELRTGSVSARGDYPAGGPGGLALPRDRLDAALLDAARREGARVVQGVAVRHVHESAHGLRELSTRGPAGEPGVWHARVVVGADGLRSVVARSIHAVRRPPRLRKLSLTARVRGSRTGAGRGLVVLSDDDTVGLAPVHADASLWNLTVVVDARRWGPAAAGAPLSFLMERADRAGLGWLDEPTVVEGPWASGPFDWAMRTVVADGLLLVGDAAGYYDPLTGQGIYRALHSAELAAEAIDSALRAGRVSGPDFGNYARRHRSAFRPGVLVQHAVEAVISRPALRQSVLGRLAQRAPALSALLGVTGDQAPARSLLRPTVLGALVLPSPKLREVHAHDR